MIFIDFQQLQDDQSIPKFIENLFDSTERFQHVFFPHLALAKKIAERLELIIAHLDLPDHCLGITSDAIY